MRPARLGVFGIVQKKTPHGRYCTAKRTVRRAKRTMRKQSNNNTEQYARELFARASAFPPHRSRARGEGAPGGARQRSKATTFYCLQIVADHPRDGTRADPTRTCNCNTTHYERLGCASAKRTLCCAAAGPRGGPRDPRLYFPVNSVARTADVTLALEGLLADRC